MKKQILILVICIITLAFIFPSISANPSISLIDPGTSGLPTNVPGNNYLLDSNCSDLRFTYEYVYIQIGNVIENHPEFNATYIITNSGNNWINQTIAIPGLENSENATLTLDGNNITWWYEYNVDIENYVWSCWEFYGCYLLNVTFAPFQSRTINMGSQIRFHVYFDSNPILEPGNLSVKYIVTTGNSWLGGIGEADIVVDFNSNFLSEITNTTFDDFTYQNTTDVVRFKYHYIDWSPTADLSICWIPKEWPITVNATILEKSTYEINETIEIKLDAEFDLDFGVKYLCDFGDNTIANWTFNSTLFHNYSTTGTYSVKIWARDEFYKVVSEPVYLTITIEEEAVQDIPGFGFELIFLATVIGFIIVKKRK